jgi:hypothetical protein
VERAWGIVFNQVGIEKVRIMSSRLFEQPQARFRDGLRLAVERKRISTDREINHESNAAREEKERKESGLAKSEATLLEARTAVSHLQAALDAKRLGTEPSSGRCTRRSRAGSS